MWVDQVKLSAHRQRFDLGGACLPQEICAEERLCRCGAQSIVTVVATDQDVVLPERIDEVLSELLVLFELILDVSSDVPEVNSGLIQRQPPEP